MKTLKQPALGYLVGFTALAFVGAAAFTFVLAPSTRPALAGAFLAGSFVLATAALIWALRGEVAASSPSVATQVASAAILAASIVGAGMALTSATMLTGTGRLWTGAAIAVAAAVAALVMRSITPGWVMVLAILAAVVALSSAAYVEHELDNKRDELRSDLSEIG